MTTDAGPVDALIPRLATQVLATPSRRPIVPAAPARPDAA